MKLIKTVMTFSLFVLFTFSVTTTNGQGTKGHIPFYAEPYYNYDPLKITIGKYKTKLLTNDPSELVILANTIKADINNTDIESLYFLSIRLYDLGKKALVLNFIFRFSIKHLFRLTVRYCHAIASAATLPA
jgi:hypothetical protein